MEKINVLMTGAGAPGGPGIIKALLSDDRINLVTVDANSNASGRYLSNKFIQIPSADNDKFIDTIIDICKENNIQIVFPLVTRELFRFAACKQQFDEINVKVIVSDYSSLNIVNDKVKVYDFLASKDILTPAYRTVYNYDQFEQAIFELGYPDIPVCFKPAISNGSRGFRVLNNNIDEFQLLFNEKPNSTYISLDKVKSIFSRNKIPELLVSEYLPGEEYTIDSIVNHGKVRLVIPRIRSKMNNGISVAGNFEMNAEIIDYSNQILNSLPLHGPIGIQVKKSVSGVFKILEINPRVQGTSCALLGGGINFPVACVDNELDIDISDYTNHFNWNIAFARYYSEVFYEL